MGRIKRMEIHTLAVKLTALYLIGIVHNGRQLSYKGYRLAKYVLHGGLIGIIVVRIKRQHRTRKLIHNIYRRSLDYHILGKKLRKLAAF